MQDTPTDEFETSRDLLRAWVRDHSQEAFRELIKRYTDLVYSTAKRRLGGLEHGAADVTQVVFSRLARKAAALPPDLILGAWLHRQAVRQALNFLRGERRRHAREQHSLDMTAVSPDDSWQTLAPHLDEAVASLPEKERSILILRYYEDERISGIAAELGISKEAAQKRLERATAHLRERLQRRMGAAPALAVGWLAGRTVQAAPPGLATRVAAESLSQFGKTGLLAHGWDRLTGSPLAAAAGLVAGAVLGIPVAQALQSTFRPPPPMGAAMAGKPPLPRSKADREKAEQEAILVALERLGQGPENERMTVEFNALMEHFPAGRVPALVRAAAESLSLRSRVRMMKPLLALWSSQDPRAVMEFLLASGNPAWAGMRWVNAHNAWMSQDSAATARWLVDHAGEADHFGREWDSFKSLMAATIQRITQSNPAGGVPLLLTLPAPLRSGFHEALADDDPLTQYRHDWPSEKWETLTNAVLAAEASGDLEPEALLRVHRKWSKAFPSEAEAWADRLPDGTPVKMLSGLIEPRTPDPEPDFDGPFMKVAWLESDEVYTARPNKSLARRGSMPLSEAIALIAASWPRSLSALTGWIDSLNVGADADAALAITARRLAGYWDHSTSLEPPPAHFPSLEGTTLTTAGRISDPEAGELLLRGLFRRWHVYDPVAARTWLEQSDWPEERTVSIKKSLEIP
jgi:RNA polymerase sigma factor (sigma-70 family)